MAKDYTHYIKMLTIQYLQGAFSNYHRRCLGNYIITYHHSKFCKTVIHITCRLPARSGRLESPRNYQQKDLPSPPPANSHSVWGKRISLRNSFKRELKWRKILITACNVLAFRKILPVLSFTASASFQQTTAPLSFSFFHLILRSELSHAAFLD